MKSKERLENLPELPNNIKPSEYTTPRQLSKTYKSKRGKKGVDIQRIYQMIFGWESKGVYYEPTLTAYKKDGRICVIIP